MRRLPSAASTANAFFRRNRAVRVARLDSISVTTKARSTTGKYDLTWDGEGGRLGYLMWAAVYQPAQFLTLLNRVMPLQINTKTEKTYDVTYRSVEQVTLELKDNRVCGSLAHFRTAKERWRM
jgi:hypothetical protein